MIYILGYILVGLLFVAFAEYEFRQMTPPEPIAGAVEFAILLFAWPILLPLMVYSKYFKS